MNNFVLLRSTLLLLSLITRAAYGATCPNHPELGPKLRNYTGIYKNPAFGYTTRLPQGTTGLDTDNPEYQRGFVVILPQEGGTLSVYAETNSSELKTPTAASMADLEYLRADIPQISAIHKATMHLDSHPAAEITAQFKCSNDLHTYQHIAVFSLGTNRRFLYTLTWEGPTARAAEAATLIHALERSWKFIPTR